MRTLFYLFIIVQIALITFANNTIDPDYWARLLQGNAFWLNHSIMKQDIFSYTDTHFWLDHEWGSSIVFSFLQNNFGFIGVLFFKILLLFIIFLLVIKTIELQTQKNNNLYNIIIFTLTLYSLSTLSQSWLRCHFFTFFFFTLFLYILELVRKQGNNKLLLLLPPLMLIWSNMHGGCVSALGMLFIYTIGEFLNKKQFKYYLFSLIGCFAVMFINPYGTDYVKFIFMASTMPRPYITEWLSPFLDKPVDFMICFKITYIIFLFIIIKNLKNLKYDYTKLLLLIACAVVSFKNIKSTPFFIITSLVFLYEYIVVYFSDKKNKFIEVGLMAVFLIFAAKSISPSFFLSCQPYKAVEFLKINNLKGKILAPLDMGSYIAYKLYPNNTIYMDGRYEEVYFDETKNLLDNFYNAKQNREDIFYIKPDYIITPSDALINDFLLKRKDYKLTYRDEYNWIFIEEKSQKRIYKLPSNNILYYAKTAFDRLY